MAAPVPQRGTGCEASAVPGPARRALAVLGVLAGTIGATAGCWVRKETCAGFTIDYAMDAHGQDSPAAAVETYSQGGATGVPGSGWRQVGTDDGGVRLRSGAASVHVAQLPDGSWIVDSGSTC